MDWWQDGAAIYAAVVSTGALFLEVRRWFESGPRLKVTIMCPAVQFGGREKDKNEYLAVTVSNRGDVPTSVTHFTLHEYPSFLSRLRRRATWNAIVPSQGNPQAELPHHLEPGRYWIGMAKYEGKLKELAEKGTLYVGIFAVHYGNAVLVKVNVKKDRALEEAKKNPASNGGQR